MDGGPHSYAERFADGCWRMRVRVPRGRGRRPLYFYLYDQVGYGTFIGTDHMDLEWDNPAKKVPRVVPLPVPRRGWYYTACDSPSV